MRVVEIQAFGDADNLGIGERDKPAPGAGEVLIRVAATALNRADILQRKGMYPPPPGASDIPGLEAAGTVEAIGPDVIDIEVGDRVCALLTGGGYAEYALAAQECVLPVPEGLSMAEAASLPETFFTVWSNVFERAYLDRNETLLVHGGSSGIGVTAIQLAKAFGARVFVTAGSDEKCDFCKGLGADLAINYKTQDFAKDVMAATSGDEGGAGVDVILDMVAGDYIQKNLNCLKVGGRLVFIAFMGGTRAEVDFAAMLMKRLTITGSGLRGRSNAFKGAVADSLRDLVWPLIADGTIKPIIASTFPLAEAAEAHKLMETSAHMGKIVLEVEG